MDREVAPPGFPVMVGPVVLLGRALAALLALAACVLHDAPRAGRSGDEHASVRVASAPDVDVEPSARAVVVAPARALVPRTVPLPVPTPSWLPCDRQLTRARIARARRRRALVRRRARRGSRAGPDDDDF